MSTRKICPVILTILDGWGCSGETSGNAVLSAKTPILDSLLHNYPTTFLNASGESVGLPLSQVGNSEVGHTTIGAGRVLLQELVKISKSIENNTFFLNPVLNQVCSSVNDNRTSLHLIGLCSDGGVHSHIDHLIALIKLGKQYQIKHINIHVITDGRDTEQKSCLTFIKKIQEATQDLQNVSISTVMGRYYAMDRDCRWNRTEEAYKVLTQNSNIVNSSLEDLISTFYKENITDEFIPPSRISQGTIQEGDGIIFFNYRPDRMRQLLQAFAKPNFKGFKRKNLYSLHLATFTRYVSSLSIPIAFPPNIVNNFLGEIIAKNFLRQFRISETEKYAHVTYFFNGGVEEPFAGEDRELIPSPKVSTYDLTPGMSAKEITTSLVKAIEKECYSFIVVNYANPDMLGHTGNFSKTVEAMSIVDENIGILLDIVGKVNGTLIITADHGNAECMQYDNGEPHTSHTSNLVPFILIEGENRKITGHGANATLRQEGSLADIAPTILDILNLQQPSEMTGQSLIVPVPYETRVR
uniref:phosphoglycerate mutase n=1 Tax=Madagascaria erythrocladioides TaxID=753684 RepID=UPI001BF11BA0|nr:phosphoglycerate mutase [Madagascaria erythrocladioides]QUE29010.1 pgmA [Madagascaria erythrocladioides]UNJ16562.1 phosphoglycerate mutase [Madagascaria erythrocladioides]